MLILIADDERLVRLSLKSMIEEINPNMHTFIEVKNGQELINITKNNTPDLAFVDINMPLMDGLSAISLCKDRCNHTQWFILTGETEFHFAKKSLSLGVCDYLLKPISLNDLTPILDKAQSKIYNDLIEENNRFNLSVLYTINLLSSGTNLPKDKLLPLIKEEYKCYLFVFDSLENDNKKDIIIKEALEKIRIFMNNLLVENINFSLPYIYNDCIVLMIKSDLNSNIHFSTLLNNLKDKTYYVTILESSSCKDLLEVNNELNTLSNYLSVRALFSLGDILSIDNIRKNHSDKIITFSKLIVDLCTYYNKKDVLLYKDTVSKISNNKISRNIFDSIEKSNLNKFLNFHINCSFNIDLNFDNFINSLLSHSEGISNPPSKISNSKLVEDIMNYVNLNYMHDIGVNTIATLYKITPNYLSKIFHEKSGLKFSDYIAQVRVQEGKKLLLSDPSITVKEVSEKVGYYSSRNFTKQFVKLLGIYPSDLIK